MAMWMLFIIVPVFAAAFYTGMRTLSFFSILIPGFGKRAKVAGKLIYGIFLLFIIASVLVRGIGGLAVVRNIGFICMAFFLYLFLSCLAYELIFAAVRLVFYFIIKSKASEKNLLKRYERRREIIKTGLAAFALVTAISTTSYGLYHAADLKKKSYSIEIATKQPEGLRQLRVVLVSDLHLGSKLSTAFLENLVHEINAQEADVICIAGDIINNNFEALKEPEEAARLLASLQSKYGVYACLGNHDIDGMYDGASTGHEKIAAFLEAAQIELLEDEAMLVADSFVIAGRKDRRPLGGGTAERKSVQELIAGWEDYPVLLLDHQPQGANEVIEAGVDLLMCGHTHKGQVFPGNLIVQLTADYTYGYAKEKNTNIVVTSGAGYWGPPCRVASDSEFVVLELSIVQEP